MRQWKFSVTVAMFVLLSTGVMAEQSAAPAVSPGLTASPSSAVVNLTGTETRLLPANYDVWSCEWAPDGKSLVFSGKKQGELSTKMRIWFWQLNPIGSPEAITNTENLTDFSPHWSPDGQQLVMMRVAYTKSVASGIWLKNVVTGEGKQLTIGNQDRDPYWSPDGKQIVFSRSNGPYQAQLFVLNVSDGSSEVLPSPANEILNSPYWGKDGKIYFTKMTPVSKNVVVAGQTYPVMDFGKGSIWSMIPGEATAQPVILDENDNRLPALSPDGTKLAFVSDRFQGKGGNGKFDRGSLFLKDLTTGEIKLVTTKVGLNGGSLSWSPDGKKLAFFTFRSIRPAVWVINVASMMNGASKASGLDGTATE